MYERRNKKQFLPSDSFAPSALSIHVQQHNIIEDIGHLNLNQNVLS